MGVFSARRNKQEWEALALQFCSGESPLQMLIEALQGGATFNASRLLGNQQLKEQQYAGYVLLHVHRTCPNLIVSLLPLLLELLRMESKHGSIYRQVFSVFQDRSISEDLAGPLFETAAATFLNRGLPIAARARALDTIQNVAEQYPGLWEEALELSNFVNIEESPGMQSISSRVRKRAMKELGLRP